MDKILQETKTPFDWCVELRLRPLDLRQWPLEWYGSKERHFYEFPTMDKAGMLDALKECTVKPNSLPRKTANYLEYRMYGLVPYNISPIQQGIQYGHAVQEYNNMMRFSSGPNIPEFEKWSVIDKTFIILNGGTTNNNPDKLGTLNHHLQFLKELGVTLASFYEPDLGDQLTAIVFLVDERVFDKINYPDYERTLPTWPRRLRNPSAKQLDEYNELEAKNYEAWVEKIGGERNAVLREFLRPLRLA